MRLRHRNQAVQAIAPHRSGDSFADRVALGERGSEFSTRKPNALERFVKMLGEYAVPSMKQILA